MKQSNQKGFTLVEIMIVMSLITIISMLLLSPLGSWLAFSRTTSNDRKLQDLKSAISRYYELNAMAIDSAAATTPATLGVVTSNMVAAGGTCAQDLATYQGLGMLLSDTPQQASLDAYKNPWCIFVSAPQTVSRDGATLTFRNVAIISTGENGVIDAGTSVSAAGVITLSPTGDDKGIMLSGEDIQYQKLSQTLAKMQRIANTYEIYFTTRYLANASRDMSIDYFTNEVDTTGSVASTAGVFKPVSTQLSNLGVVGVDALTAWEANNNIELGNYNESVNGITVRSPNTTGTGIFPYTTILRARVPSPTGTTYVAKVVVGNY